MSTSRKNASSNKITHVVSFDKDDAHRTLDRVNALTESYNVVSSAVLAFFSILIPILLSTDFFKILKILVKNARDVRKPADICMILSIIASFIIALTGIFYLVKVLTPRITTKGSSRKIQSIMFFGIVSEFNTFEEYLNSVKKYDENMVMEDLLRQIYEASKICSRKNKCYKTGLILLITGFITFSLLIAVSNLIV